MSDTQAVELMLRIDAGAHPLCGEIVPRAGQPVSFVGWLELLRCLSELTESADREVAAGGLDGELNPGS